LGQHLLYNNATGALYYDADGQNGSAAVQIALIGSSTHPNVLSTDFLIII
jgi:Ca2+-binding RTX toxin-like protein